MCKEWHVGWAASNHFTQYLKYLITDLKFRYPYHVENHN